MSFEQQKQEIIDLVNHVNNIFIENAGDVLEDADGYSGNELSLKILDSLAQLKPDYPTCSTCKYLEKIALGFSDKDDVLSCMRVEQNIVFSNGAESDDFGCIHHSSRESKNE